MTDTSITIGSTIEPVWARGHGPKILEGTLAALAKGRLPANPRPVEFQGIITTELGRLGYQQEHMPSRTAIDVRYDKLFRSPQM